MTDGVERMMESLQRALKRSYLYPYAAVNAGLRRAVAQLAEGIRGGTLVDVGCGARPYERFFAVDRYIGIDVPVSGFARERRPDVWFDGRHIPFASRSVDHVLCTAAFQHTLDPYAYMGELARLIRPGGSLILSVPQSEPTMEIPYDRHRFTIHALRDLCRDHGMRMVREQPGAHFWQTMAFHFNCMLVLTLLPRSRALAVPVCSTAAVFTQSVAALLDSVTRYDRDVNSWVIQAAKE